MKGKRKERINREKLDMIVRSQQELYSQSEKSRLSLSPNSVQPHDFEIHPIGKEEDPEREMNHVSLYWHFIIIHCCSYDFIK